ncbi:TIGR02646 family protein [Shewanella sp. M16]|uniref:retron system putative HNH endonuclease n=1 Tax=Shewanella sp. M16 TaxID=2830837 RepID=UPI001BAFCE76|nr:retron system putative HNH endonuclease [Shewanella sp. M16]MBS0044493.1 TIGR02646 family protein [Shewanella sp. M16]
MIISDWYLNIKVLPSISKKSIDYLTTLKPFKASLWELKTDEMKAYKKELLEKLLKIQNNRCVYCGLSLSRRSQDREHFVHKAAKKGYQEFMFNSDNLFASCEFCNRRLKGQKNVINQYNADYSKCTFKIIHPFYDLPDNYIQFIPSKNKPIKVIPTKTDCGKGKETIRMFELDTFVMAQERIGFIAQLDLLTSPFSNILQYKP